MKDQTVAGRRQADRYGACAVVASLALGGCVGTAQDKSGGDTGSCLTCVDEGGTGGSHAAETSTLACAVEPEQTSTATATPPIDTSNNTSVDTSNGSDAGAAAGSEVAPLDGGQTCRDSAACSSSNSSDSESDTHGSSFIDVGATANDVDSGGLATDASPSRGCSLGIATPALSLNYFSQGTTITLPDAYDGSTPLPIVLALHSSGMFKEMETNFSVDHPLRKNFIVVTPHSIESVGGFESERLNEFAALRFDLSDNLCFDTERFFAIGHASGARVAAGLSFEDYEFKAIALVGAVSRPANSIPTLFVHANEDSYSAPFDDIDGSTSAARFASNNGCTSDTVPVLVPTAQGTTSADTADCVDYLGCTASVRWCRFDYVPTSAAIEYWPSFANDLIYDFFVSAP